MTERGAKRPRIDLRLLSYFHAVSSAGNITRAAETLNIAQPTLSKALRLLETQLGAALFVRHAHGVTLTPMGERLLQHAVAIRAQISRAETEVEEARLGSAGEVRIGAGPSWVRRFLPDVVVELSRERPGLKIEVATGFDMSLFGGLLTGELDFVVAELPLERDREFYFKLLTSDDLIVVGRADHPFAARRSLSTEEVLAAEWALPPRDSLARRKLDGRVTSLGKVPPSPCVTSASQTFLMSICGRSDMLLYTTRSQLMSPEAASLRELDVPELVTSREAGLIYRAGAVLSPAAELVADRLAVACKSGAPN